MLSDLQGASRAIIANTAPQARAATPMPAPVSTSLKDAAPPVVDVPEVIQVPKVQAPKPIDIKVDVEKLRANLQESLQKLNETMRDGGRSLNFQMDDKVGGFVVLVKNTDTGEVIRQIPNDVVVRIAHNLEAFKGLLHNELT